eukprot:184803_1
MCDGAGLTPSLNAANGQSRGAVFAPFVTVRQLLRFSDNFTVIDIREESERKNDDEKEYIKNIQFIPMGKMLSGAWQKTEESKKILSAKPKICVLCPLGGRA